jgi:hypothetical protein
LATCIDTVSSEIAVATRREPTRVYSAVRRAGKSSAQSAPKSVSTDQRPEAAAPGREHRGQRERGHQTERLGEHEHAPAVHPIGHDAGEGTQDHERRGAGEGGQADHERRVRELEREPAEEDQVHPARAVDAQAREPEPAVGALAQDGRERLGGGQGGRRRSDAAHRVGIPRKATRGEPGAIDS